MKFYDVYWKAGYRGGNSIRRRSWPGYMKVVADLKSGLLLFADSVKPVRYVPDGSDLAADDWEVTGNA